MATNHFYDETANHPIVVAAMAEGRPLLRSALLGAYVELVSAAQREVVAAIQAGHDLPKPGIVSLGTIVAIEPFDTRTLLDGLLRYRYLEKISDTTFRLIPHAKLAHWEAPEVLAWRAQQRRDTQDPVLRAAVRFRDGDQCRVCHILVKWGGKSGEDDTGTLDHVTPRVAANGDPEKLAVTCMRCNRLRSDRPDANEWAPHQPVPDVPFYTPGTVRYLRERGYKVGRPTGQKWFLPRIEIVARPATQADTAPSDLPTGQTPLPTPQEAPQTPSWGPTEDVRPALADTAPSGLRPAVAADHAADQRDLLPEIPRSEVSPKFDASSPEVRSPNFAQVPPVSRSDEPPSPGGPRCGEGKGSGPGQGDREGRARRRGRRGRRGRLRREGQEEQQ